MQQPTWKRIGKALAIWVPTVILGLFFILQGWMKIQPGSPWAGRFEEWGFPAGMLLVVGVVELLGGIALFVPRVAAYAALALGVVMVGALGTHLVHAEWPNVGVTLVLTLAFAALARARLSRAVGASRHAAPLVASVE